VKKGGFGGRRNELFLRNWKRRLGETEQRHQFSANGTHIIAAAENLTELDKLVIAACAVRGSPDPAPSAPALCGRETCPERLEGIRIGWRPTAPN
jgi:hypothetical protein